MDAELALYRRHFPVELHVNILPSLQVLKMLEYSDEDILRHHYLNWKMEDSGYQMPDHYGPFTGDVIGNGRITLAYAEALQECFFCENPTDYVPLVGHYHTVKLFEEAFNRITDVQRTLDLMPVQGFVAGYAGEFSSMRGLALHIMQVADEFIDCLSDSADDSSDEDSDDGRVFDNSSADDSDDEVVFDGRTFIYVD